jgi:hypothetical protein
MSRNRGLSAGRRLCVQLWYGRIYILQCKETFCIKYLVSISISISLSITIKGFCNTSYILQKPCIVILACKTPHRTARDGARSAIFQKFCVVLCIVCFVSFCVLFVCKCVLYYCHRVATQLQLTNMSLSYHIISYHIVIVFTTVFLKMNPRFRKTKKASKN